LVLDPEGENILNGEKSRLKAIGIQEGAEGVPLLAPSGHVDNELPLAEEGRGAAVDILLEPMEKLGGRTQLDQSR
jgi:hypothetical protein